MATKRKKKPIVTMAQATQRELAWLLYITEGYVSNLARALTVNAYTLDDQTLNMMAEHHSIGEATCLEIRRKLAEISKEI